MHRESFLKCERIMLSNFETTLSVSQTKEEQF